MILLKRPFMLLSLVSAMCMLFASVSSAELDGRTEIGAGLRSDSQQTLRVHLFSEPGRCLRVVTAGVQTRNADPAPPTASGTIVLPAGPAAGNIVWAGLYWEIIADIPPVNAVTLNGSPVSPVSFPVTASPCWPERSAYPFFADVTGLVGAGANTVAGLDDSGTLASTPESEGASLVVIYTDPNSAACEIIVTDGNDLLNFVGQIIDNALPVACGDDLPVALTFLGADGQTGIHGYAPDDQLWNGAYLAPGHDDWNASDPDAPGTEPDLGWDTDVWSLSTGGGNVASISMTPMGGPGDCVNWIATVLEVGVGTCIAANEACCFLDGTCAFITADECVAAGGTPQGPGTDCDPNDCPQPPPEGACCFPDGSCRVMTEADCTAAGGILWIAGADCDPNPCPPTPTQNTTWGEIKSLYR